jgi:hypothetical protein
MESHTSFQSSSFSPINSSDLSPGVSTYQQFAQWLGNHLEKLKAPTDSRLPVEVLSSTLKTTLSFA